MKDLIVEDHLMASSYEKITNIQPTNILLHHSMVTRKDIWKCSFHSGIKESNDNFQFNILTTLNHIKINNTSIIVRADLIYNDIDPSDWLAIYYTNTEQPRVIINGIKKKYTCGVVADVLSEFIFSGEKYLCRSKTYKDSGRVFLVECICLEIDYGVLSKEFSLAIDSFKFTSSMEISYAEDLSTVFCKNPLHFQFSYPASWIKRYTMINRNANLKILMQRPSIPNNLLYLIVCENHNVESTSKIVCQHFHDISRLGFKFGGSILESVPSNRFEKAEFLTTYALKDSINFQTSILVVKYGIATFIINLICTQREVSPTEWAISKRAFGIVRDTLRVE